MTGISICCPKPSSRDVPVLCSKYSPLQPGACLTTQPSRGKIREKALGHRHFKLNVQLFSQTANSSGFETSVERLPHAAGAQRACPALQELQMNGNAAIGFAGRNTALLEGTCYLFPEVNTTYKERKRRKEFQEGC